MNDWWQSVLAWPTLPIKSSPYVLYHRGMHVENRLLPMPLKYAVPGIPHWENRRLPMPVDYA